MNENISSFKNKPTNLNQTYPNEVYNNSLHQFNISNITSAIWAANDYELSEDLRQVRLDLLEKQYGVPGVARHAAKIIQRAYRQYTLGRSFEKLRYERAEGRRHGGKFYRDAKGVGRSQTVWSDMLAMVEDSSTATQNDQNSINSQLEANTMNEILSMPHSCSADNVGIQAWQAQCGFIPRPLFDPILEEIFANNKYYENEFECKKEKQILNQSLICFQSPNNTNFSTTDNKDKCINKTDLNNTINILSKQSKIKFQAKDVAVKNLSANQLSTEVDLPSSCFEDLLENCKNQRNSGDTSDPDDYENADVFRALKNHYGNVKSLDHISDQIGNQKINRNSDVTMNCQLASSESTISSNEEVEKIYISSINNTTQDYLHESKCRILIADSEVRLRRCNANVLSKTICLDPPTSIHSPNRTQSLKPDLTWPRSVFEKSIDDLTLTSRGSFKDTSICGASHGSKNIIKDKSIYKSNEDQCVKSQNNICYKTNTNNKKDTFVNNSTVEQKRKRSYRIGLNLFNRKPEQGIKFLVERKFLDNRPISIAKFLITRNGLSKQMIGEYIGNLQKQFNMQVLICFASLIDLAKLPIDEALRKFQSYFRMPGEAQKIERLMEAFAHRYCESNPLALAQFRNQDTIFLLAFAITMLNTDLHNSSIKPERKMKLNDFIKNLRGIDDGEDIDTQLLSEIYERIKDEEFKPGSDHVMHVIKVQSLIIGCKQNLVESYRRLVCYCRLYEIKDLTRKEKIDLHQREVFLFNDSILITKDFFKKKTRMYKFKQLLSLFGMAVHIFSTPHYKYGIQLSTGIDKKVLIILNARNLQDRNNFVEDLKDIILEVNEMETFRIEEELKKQQHGLTSSQPSSTLPISSGNVMTSASSTGTLRYSNDSGVVDVGSVRKNDLIKMLDCGMPIHRLSAPECEVLSKGKMKIIIGEQRINHTPLLKSHSLAIQHGSGSSLDSGMALTESSSINSYQNEITMSKANKNLIAQIN